MFVYALLNMDDLTKHRKDRLRALIEGKPYAGNQAEFGRKAGLTKARITQLLNPDEPFGERAAESLCAKLELSPRWFEQGLATGEGEMQPTGGALPAPALLTRELIEGAVRVPVLANAASMGGGHGLMDEDVICSELTLTPQFVAEQLRPARPAALRFIHGYGDSMVPTFSSGDVLLVDTDMCDVKIDGIYVLKAHDRLFIKRVRQRMDGSYEISSDNPTHRTVDTLNGDHQVEVKGRVVWCWNGRRL